MTAPKMRASLSWVGGHESKDVSELRLADILVIEALDEETRAVVERYARVGGAAGVIVDPPDAYRKGWAAAMEYAKREVHGAYFPSEPPRGSK